MIKGYYYCKSRPNAPYRVIISINGKMAYIGNYKTPEEARTAYEKAREQFPCQPKRGGRKKGSKYVYKKKEKKKPVRSLNMPPWTEEQKTTLVRLFETTDLSYSGIGEALGRTEKAVYGMLRRIRLNQVSK